ncbi:hypothetical protein F2Q69_00010027 [Brassica cretica]|uniref:KIB1-4 beta-propeller domain-containing protein n=1 Tax=Brassica cretica TaxID=69181 RepID=A0A8S9P7D4_BRACR|nr:hypothetical protein F2Q69_00010027 [Brassica cretica]
MTNDNNTPIDTTDVTTTPLNVAATDATVTTAGNITASTAAATTSTILPAGNAADETTRRSLFGAVYTQDIGDLTIFISKAEAFCVRASSFPGVSPNHVYILDVMEISFFKLPDSSITTLTERIMSPYVFPPQNIEY